MATQTATFASTGAEQSFVVPAGVTSLTVVATSGRGGGITQGGGGGGSGSSGAVASASGLSIASPPAGTAPSITLPWTVPATTPPLAPDTRIDQSPAHELKTARKKARATFVVRAVAADVSDPTPATATVKVKRTRR